MNPIFCIDHGFVFLQHSGVGDCHEYSVWNEYQEEKDWCFMDSGWATCPEPEYDPDWDLNLVEPPADELAEIDANEDIF